MKTVILALLAGYFAVVIIGYWSPYERCVRATMAEEKYPLNEADARYICARAFAKN